MEVTFVRTVDAPDRIYVRRSTGEETSWVFPTYGNELPHDLVHLVIEARFGIRTGIWALIDGGLDLKRANSQANQTGGKRKYLGTGLDRDEVYLSEALAAARWWDRHATDEDRIQQIREGCESYGIAVSPTVTVGRVRQVRDELDGLRARWRALVPKGALTFEYDPAKLELHTT